MNWLFLGLISYKILKLIKNNLESMCCATDGATDFATIIMDNRCSVFAVYS